MNTLKEILNSLKDIVSYKRETQGNCDIITIKDTDIMFISGILRLAIVKSNGVDVSMTIDGATVRDDFITLSREKDMDYIKIFI